MPSSRQRSATSVAQGATPPTATQPVAPPPRRSVRAASRSSTARRAAAAAAEAASTVAPPPTGPPPMGAAAPAPPTAKRKSKAAGGTGSKAKKSRTTPTAQAPTLSAAVSDVPQTSLAPPPLLDTDVDDDDVVVLPDPPAASRAADDFLRQFAAGAPNAFARPHGQPHQPEPVHTAAHSAIGGPVTDQAQTIAALAAKITELTATVAALTSVTARPPAPTSFPTAFTFPVPPPSAAAPAPPTSLQPAASVPFDYSSNRAKGEYCPPPSHVLVASRLFREAQSTTGTQHAPHSFALYLYAAMRSRYRASPALVAAVYSGRLGSRGASIMCLSETDRDESLAAASSNVNINLDFKPGAQLPAGTCLPCNSMADLITAVTGLCNFAQEHWFDHGYHLASALRRFVLSRHSSVPHPRDPVLRRTLNYVDLWLGNALGALESESPDWWSRYNAAVRAIDVKSPEWLVDLVHANSITAAPTPQPPAVVEPRPAQAMASARPNTAPAPMPDHIRSLIPRSGQNEPCLRHFSGNGCPGGATQCLQPNRLHEWPEPLPAELVKWARANVGMNRKPRRYRPNGSRA